MGSLFSMNNVKVVICTMIIGEKTETNNVISLFDKLAEEIQNEAWSSITLCSAYITKPAAKSLVTLLEEVRHKRKLKINLIIGAKNYFTVPEAVRILQEYIKSNSNSEFDLRLLLPRNADFHIKCYLFQGERVQKAVVGSANLTDNGLKSTGELMIEVSDKQTVDEISVYINEYVKESEEWSDCIKDYEKLYQKEKPELNKVKVKKLFKKLNNTRNEQDTTISETAPTVGILQKTAKEDEEKVVQAFNSIKDQFTDIIKSHWVLFDVKEDGTIEDIRRKYPVGSSFDSPSDTNKTWEIGTKRKLSIVGAIESIGEGQHVMFVKKGCIHYVVTEEISKEAERLKIKSEDKNYIPAKEEMDMYKEFILSKRGK